jgi:hypothetical protein
MGLGGGGRWLGWSKVTNWIFPSASHKLLIFNAPIQNHRNAFFNLSVFDKNKITFFSVTVANYFLFFHMIKLWLSKIFSPNLCNGDLLTVFCLFLAIKNIKNFSIFIWNALLNWWNSSAINATVLWPKQNYLLLKVVKSSWQNKTGN